MALYTGHLYTQFQVKMSSKDSAEASRFLKRWGVQGVRKMAGVEGGGNCESGQQL
jgi:hypothetical protein